MVDGLRADTRTLRLVSALSLQIAQVNSSISLIHLCGICLPLWRLLLPQKLVVKKVDRFWLKHIGHSIPFSLKICAVYCWWGLHAYLLHLCMQSSLHVSSVKPTLSQLVVLVVVDDLLLLQQLFLLALRMLQLNLSSYFIFIFGFRCVSFHSRNKNLNLIQRFDISTSSLGWQISLQFGHSSFIIRLLFIHVQQNRCPQLVAVVSERAP